MRRKEEREMENLWKTVTEKCRLYCRHCDHGSSSFCSGKAWRNVGRRDFIAANAHEKNCHYRYDVSACIYSADL